MLNRAVGRQTVVAQHHTLRQAMRSMVSASGPGNRLKRAFGSLPLMYLPVSAPPDSGLYASRPTLHCRGAHTWAKQPIPSLSFTLPWE